MNDSITRVTPQGASAPPPDLKACSEILLEFVQGHPYDLTRGITPEWIRTLVSTLRASRETCSDIAQLSSVITGLEAVRIRFQSAAGLDGLSAEINRLETTRDLLGLIQQPVSQEFLTRLNDLKQLKETVLNIASGWSVDDPESAKAPLTHLLNSLRSLDTSDRDRFGLSGLLRDLETTFSRLDAATQSAGANGTRQIFAQSQFRESAATAVQRYFQSAGIPENSIWSQAAYRSIRTERIYQDLVTTPLDENREVPDVSGFSVEELDEDFRLATAQYKLALEQNNPTNMKYWLGRLQHIEECRNRVATGLSASDALGVSSTLILDLLSLNKARLEALKENVLSQGNMRSSSETQDIADRIKSRIEFIDQRISAILKGLVDAMQSLASYAQGAIL